MNVALHQPTAQSSTGFNGRSSRAVNGDTNPSYSKDSCTHTRKGDLSVKWWAVQLPQTYSVMEICITNRADAACE